MDGGEGLGGNPFGALDSAGLPDGGSVGAGTVGKGGSRKRKAAIVDDGTEGAGSGKSRGRVDVRREKSGRGGKTVTVLFGFKGIANEEKIALAKSIQKSCGVGGAVKDGNIEIQGDKREEAAEALEKAGFRVVFAGG